MTKFARLSTPDANGVERVVELVGDDPAARMHPLLAGQFEPAPEDTTVASIRIDGSWTHAPAPAPPAPEAPRYRGLSFVAFLSLVQDAGGMSDEDAVSVLATSIDPSVVLLRLKLERAEGPITRDNPVVDAGLQTLVDKGLIDAAGRDAILANWPAD